MIKRTTWLAGALFCLATSAVAGDDLPTPDAKLLGELGLDLSQHAGKVVYLDFWASWCTPCRASFPWMAEVQERHGADGLVVLTVNVDKERRKADRFLEQTGSKLPVIYDPDGKLAELFELETMPSSFVFDRGGALRSRHDGFVADKALEIEEELTTMLAEEPTRETSD